ncbi:sugar kinase [Lentibacillus amyloliquefaciens]|uniref:2-dehydro-3-deoxygluconokinase n=1 Tax=Lentibacillus amyloliquefaciens TaxID=1472767 RepID=A0A0U4EAU6_9BACI|nr:sugar kinase [Lentibacillus amyloliquefaciens]ALX50081.1 2-dehydro-3-deoxygluconokinase [Lentibacillus amyloliquefaciens]
MDVVTLGETMVLFTPENAGPMRYTDRFSSRVAGAESNVAIGLARLGVQAGWMSRLGDDEFGKKIRSFIRGEGVDTSQAVFDETADTGLFFKEKLTPGEWRVKYYRQDSAASRMKPGDVDESYIAGAKYLHVTGITPALSESCYETVLTAIDYAKKHDVTVVFDPNLRRKLWPDNKARKVLTELVTQADIVLPGIEEAEFLFGSGSPEELSRKFREKGASTVIMKLGKKGAYYLNDDAEGLVHGFQVSEIVDPVGAGDGFSAGVLSGLLDGLSVKDAAQRGNAVGAMVIMAAGDVEGLPEKDRLLNFMDNRTRGDVER